MTQPIKLTIIFPVGILRFRPVKSSQKLSPPSSKDIPRSLFPERIYQLSLQTTFLLPLNHSIHVHQLCKTEAWDTILRTPLTNKKLFCLVDFNSDSSVSGIQSSPNSALTQAAIISRWSYRAPLLTVLSLSSLLFLRNGHDSQSILESHAAYFLLFVLSTFIMCWASPW